MKLELGKALDVIKDGISETAEVTHKKTRAFHENYVSKVLPDCGKYGDVAKFVAEMAPGVSEYNAAVDGDWTSFAVAAGMDLGSLAIGALTAGAGYAAVKGGAVAAKNGAKLVAKKATKEVAEAGAKKATKEVAEAGAKKVAQEAAETSVKKATKEVAEEGVEKTARETGEKVVQRRIKEVGEKMDETKFSAYLREVEEITHREIKPRQMDHIQKALKEQEFKKLDVDAARIHNRKFNAIREDLIREWEIKTGDKWPVYKEDILSNSGKVLKRAGQPYDAHHVIESSFGGPNKWWNLHPAGSPMEHQAGIHRADGLARQVF